MTGFVFEAAEGGGWQLIKETFVEDLAPAGKKLPLLGASCSNVAECWNDNASQQTPDSFRSIILAACAVLLMKMKCLST